MAGDAISGERERGTLETLLLTPAPRRQIATGKLLAALSLWLAAFVVTVPYVWRLGSGVGIVAEALAVGLVVGTLLAVFLASLGILISVFSSSNRFSLSLSLFVLLALFAPSQLPSSAEQGWAGNLLMRFNPVTAGEHFVGRIVDQRPLLERGHLVARLTGRRGRGLRRPGPACGGALHHAAGRCLRMTRRRPVPSLLAVAAVALVLAAAAHAASAPAGFSATVDRTRISTELGRTFVFRSTISNDGSAAADGLIAHLNIVSLRADVYVDPEDWSTHRTRYLGPLAAGGSQTITWRLKAVNSGAFGVYVAVLGGAPATSRPSPRPLVAVAVAGRKTLNAGGILSVALGVPAVLGVLTAGLKLRRRRG